MWPLQRILVVSVVVLSVFINLMDHWWDLGSSTVTGPYESLLECAPCPCHNASTTAAPSPPHDYMAMSDLKKVVNLSTYEGLQFLGEVALNRFYKCTSRKTTEETISSNCKTKPCRKQCHGGTLRFLEERRPVTALVSFPGSGNTWVRNLLEQATGVYTGSVYCDPVLKQVFPGEYVSSGNVIAVKTHQADTTLVPLSSEQFSRSNFDQTIFLIRNPYDALVSEANRLWGHSHTGLAQEIDFIGNSKWEWLLEYKTSLWAYQIHTWLDKSTIPVHIIQYEKLVANTRRELEELLAFLHQPVSNETLDCIMQVGDGYFKRRRHLNFDPFSRENEETVATIIKQAAPILQNYGIAYTKPVVAKNPVVL